MRPPDVRCGAWMVEASERGAAESPTQKRSFLDRDSGHARVRVDRRDDAPLLRSSGALRSDCRRARGMSALGKGPVALAMGEARAPIQRGSCAAATEPAA